jgi:alanyl aminopeptidase
LTQPSADLPLDPATTCPEFVKPNAQAGGYYRVAYQSGLLKALLNDGGKRLSIPERVALIQDLTALARSGDVTAAEALAAVPVLLQDPSRHIVAATAALVRSFTRGDLVPQSAQPKLARFVRETYGERARALGWSAKSGEDEDTRLLRSSLIGLVAITGDDPALGAEAVRLARRWLDDPKAIDPDMLGVALNAAGRNGDRALYDSFVAAAAQEKDRLRRQRMLGLLGSFRDPAIVKDALNVPLDPRFDMREAEGVLFSAVGEPQTRDLGWAFLKQSFDKVVNRTPREGRAFLVFAAASFCDAEHRSDAESFLTPRVAEFSGGPRNLAQVLEGIDLCIAFKNAQQRSVLSFLQKY